jgi:hypothetical protein
VDVVEAGEAVPGARNRRYFVLSAAESKLIPWRIRKRRTNLLPACAIGESLARHSILSTERRAAEKCGHVEQNACFGNIIERRAKPPRSEGSRNVINADNELIGCRGWNVQHNGRIQLPLLRVWLVGGTEGLPVPGSQADKVVLPDTQRPKLRREAVIRKGQLLMVEKR